MLLEFALWPVWVWLFVGESPTWETLVGGAMIMASVAVLASVELRHANRRLRRGRPIPT